MNHETTTAGTSPEEVLAREPETLPDGGRIVFASRKRPTTTMVLVAVVAGAVLFAGGVLTGKAVGGDDAGAAPGFADGARPQMPGNLPDGAAQDGGTPGRGGMPAGFPGGTSGEITAIGDGTLTLTTSDGTEVTVTTSDDTDVSVVDDGDLADLAVGDTVRVNGTTEDDAVEASSIVAGDVSTMFGGGFGGSGMPGGDFPPAQ
ncbi:hypothetical protein ATL41_1972 [Flavimobilis soli]|uniref:Uncharacterized protein n=1 Tax=Flavimobilis soli TaxID=442709 RepID=A0A2A9EE69_9MICO|nr:DUF5666 domain-containing protein [Flavimobilis soli]PFG37218.1 hypothetical protein ATL41_1972 [Flavimobilis soli]